MKLKGLPPNVNRISSLLEAASKSDWDLALKTLEDGALGQWTPEEEQKMTLHAAVAGGSSKQFIKKVVDFVSPASLEGRDAFGRTALHVAAMVGNTEAAKILVGKRPALVHLEEKENELPIHLAARHAHEETVWYLLSVTDNKDPEGKIYGEAGARLLKLLIIADFYDIALEVLTRCLAADPSLSHSPQRLPRLLEELPDPSLSDSTQRWRWEELPDPSLSDSPQLLPPLLEEPRLSRLMEELPHLSLSELPARLSRLLEELPDLTLSDLPPRLSRLLEQLADLSGSDSPSPSLLLKDLPHISLSHLPRRASRLLEEEEQAHLSLSDLIPRLSLLLEQLPCLSLSDSRLSRLLEELARFSPSDLPPLLSQLLEEPLEMLATRPKAFARLPCHRPRLFCRTAADFFTGDMGDIREWEKLQAASRALFKYPQAIDLLRLLMGKILKRGGLASATEIIGRQLCSAVLYGNYVVVFEMLAANPDLLTYRNQDGHGFIELAVLNRQEKVFNVVYQVGPLKHTKDYYFQTKDYDGNNILHLAARPQSSSASSAALQVQRDWRWFKEIEMNMHPSARNHKNNAGKTPTEVFAETHKELLKEGHEWMKKTAESCTVVAALVVTVAFAAAFTVPGGNDSNGIPAYLTEASFITFAISDILGLLSSTTSLLMFLSILSSRFSEGVLLYPGQYMRFSIGLVTLFFSIPCMLVTFTASFQIVLGSWFQWIAVPIGVLASVPVILFALLQFPLLLEMVYWTLRAFFFPGGKVRRYSTFRQIYCS